MCNIKPIFIIMTGLPGAGKTTISNFLEDKYNFTRVSTDDIKKEIYGEEYTTYDLNLIFNKQYKLFEELMKNKKNVISDSNSATNWQRERLKMLANKYEYNYQIVYCKANLDIIKKRLLERENNTTIHKLSHYLDELEEPIECIEVDTTLVINDSIRELEKKIMKLIFKNT